MRSLIPSPNHFPMTADPREDRAEMRLVPNVSAVRTVAVRSVQLIWSDRLF